MSELTGEARTWARRTFDYGDPVRRLLERLADRIDELEAGEAPANTPITVEYVEGLIGGKLLPWQRRSLEGRGEEGGT